MRLDQIAKSLNAVGSVEVFLLPATLIISVMGFLENWEQTICLLADWKKENHVPSLNKTVFTA